MIVCHCRNISDRDIHAAIDWMRSSDRQTIITPGRIFHALGTSSDCGCCLSVFLDTMRANPNLEVPRELQGLRSKITDSQRRDRHEG
ncbi:(2Fe-2S)-binding protein [Rhodovulum tesquicola]|nr:(2Fe-2S)-binding protein [Rhodovulum tesquicola]MCO8144777.1 (2Fe-2S)-binding protein [Rhodovulum tesquicola]